VQVSIIAFCMGGGQAPNGPAAGYKAYAGYSSYYGMG
ncbi:uncharacterized protein METZ01_LOCUS274783, partial [marine metagenome]